MLLARLHASELIPKFCLLFSRSFCVYAASKFTPLSSSLSRTAQSCCLTQTSPNDRSLTPHPPIPGIASKSRLKLTSSCCEVAAGLRVRPCVHELALSALIVCSLTSTLLLAACRNASIRLFDNSRTSCPSIHPRAASLHVAPPLFATKNFPDDVLASREFVVVDFCL